MIKGNKKAIALFILFTFLICNVFVPGNYAFKAYAEEQSDKGSVADEIYATRNLNINFNEEEKADSSEPLKLLKTIPEHEAKDVAIDEEITLIFNKPVEYREKELVPIAWDAMVIDLDSKRPYGEFTENGLIFSEDDPCKVIVRLGDGILETSKKYSVMIYDSIKAQNSDEVFWGIWGDNTPNDIEKIYWEFETSAERKSVPTYLEIYKEDERVSTGRTTIKEDESVPFRAVVRDIDDKELENETVTWESENEDIATVDENGIVKGISAGTTTLIAKSKINIYKKIEITVEEKIVDQEEEVEKLSVKLNGQEAISGASLEKIIEKSGIAVETITSVEFTEGFVSEADLKYLRETNVKTLITSDKVNVNNGVIPEEAFYQRSLKKVIMPSVTTIGKSAFENCSDLESIYFPKVKTVARKAFSDCKVLKAVHMPEVTEIDFYSFSFCYKLENLIMPKLKTTGGGSTFRNSKILKILYLPEITDISSFVFNYNFELEKIWFPKLKTINEDVFDDCSKVKEIYLEELPTIGYYHASAFSGLPEDAVVYVPKDRIEEFKTCADDNPSDGKWYGRTVKSFSESDTLGDFLVDLIDQIAPVDEITINDTNHIVSVRKAYEKLTDEQKAQVTNYAKLQAAEEKIGGIGTNVSDEIDERIESLPDPLTLADKETVVAIRVDYNLLQDMHKKYVQNLSKLEEAEATIAKLEANEVDKLIEALPDNITLADKEDAVAARKAYDKLEDVAKKYVVKFEKLEIALSKIAQLERDTLSAEALDAEIEKLPSVDEVSLANKKAIVKIVTAYNILTDEAKVLVKEANVKKLKALDAKLAELDKEKPEEPQQKSVTVSVEKFTLGQGYVIEPTKVAFNDGENVASIITRLLGEGNYENTGSIESSFYLAKVKDKDSSAVNIPQYIQTEIKKADEKIGDRKTKDWLGEFDYTSKSGWTYIVNNKMQPVGVSDYEPKNDDVIRFQFTIWGLGADLGFGNMSSQALIKTANKDALTKKVAEIRNNPYKDSILKDVEYKSYYDTAIKVLKNMQASQAEVDVALENLNKTPATGIDLGTVTVTVKDIVPRIHSNYNNTNGKVTIEELKGIGIYQEPFGTIIEDVKVSVTPGMTVRQAIEKALATKNINAYGTSTHISGIGPVSSEDNTRTVAKLSEYDAGERSKWVMGRNDQYIYDVERPYPVRDGDKIDCVYSVDGGIDIGCHPGGSTRPSSIVLSKGVYNPPFNSGDENLYVTVPQGTNEISITSIVVRNKYLPIEISSEGVSYRVGDRIPIKDGQKIKIYISNKYEAPMASSWPKTYIITVNEEKDIKQIIELIDALPAVDIIKYSDKAQIDDVRRLFEKLSTIEQLDVKNVDKLKAAEARIEEIYKANKAEAEKVKDLISPIPWNKDEITLEHKPLTLAARKAYEELTPDQQELVSSLWILERAEEVIEEIENAKDAVEGEVRDYSHDFLLSTMALNLAVGEEEEEMVMFDTPRVGEEDKAFNRDDLIITITQDDEVIAIDKRIENDGKQDLAKYYVKGLKEGIAYFTVSYPGYTGQIPIVPVSVSLKNDGPTLTTDIYEHTSKYDIMYFDGENYQYTFTAKTDKGAILSAKVNDKEYKPDSHGKFTIPLRDKYNPIIVTATKDGKTTTIAYGVRAKKIGIDITNKSREGSKEFYEGDILHISFTGVTVPVPKVSHIYNPASVRYEYETDMPRYDLLGSSSNQYAAGGLAFELTSAGEFTLTNGCVKESWFGSALYSETPTGSAPPNLNAPQTDNRFSRLPDFHFTVKENPQYNPEGILSTFVEGESKVKAGEKVTISIPDIDTDMLKRKHTTTSGRIVDILDSYTIFRTDIPGLKYVKSVNAKSNNDLENLKTITFTIPEDTKSGEYNIKGGYIWVKFGPTWWTNETDYYVGKMDDIKITVLGEEPIEPEDPVVKPEEPVEPEDPVIPEKPVKIVPEKEVNENEEIDLTSELLDVETGKTESAIVPIKVKDNLKIEITLPELKLGKEVNDFKLEVKVPTKEELDFNTEKRPATAIQITVPKLGTKEVTLKLPVPQELLKDNKKIAGFHKAQKNKRWEYREVKLKDNMAIFQTNLSTVLVAEAVDIPTQIKAANIGKYSATLEWDRVAEIDKYEIEYNNKLVEVTQPKEGKKVNYNLSGLNSSTQYTVKVRAIDADGFESDFSNEIVFTTKSSGVNSGGGGGGGSKSSGNTSSTKSTTNGTINSDKTTQVDVKDNQAVQEKDITDIRGHWAEKDIRKLMARKAVGGYPDGSFKPDNNITRAEFASILVRAFNLESQGGKGKVFTDTQGHWAKDAIATANANGIVNGYSDTIFGADDLITREQMAAMVVNALKLPKAEANKAFNDQSDISTWATEALNTAIANSLIGGYTDNTIKPLDNATRAEAVVVIVRGLEK